MATSEEPKPNQPGKLKRLCIHEKTQGMARILVTALPWPRAAGREPICWRLISSSGVAACQNSIKPGVSYTSSRYFLNPTPDMVSIMVRQMDGVSFAARGEEA